MEFDGRWACAKCTYLNAQKRNECEMCNAKKPKVTQVQIPPISIRFQTIGKSFTEDNLKHHTTLGFLKDLLESKTGIQDKNQRLYFGTPLKEIVGNADDRIVDLIKYKPGQKVVIIVKDHETAKIPLDPNSPTVEPWKCSTCTFMNYHEFFKCEMCYRERPEEELRKVDEQKKVEPNKSGKNSSSSVSSPNKMVSSPKQKAQVPSSSKMEEWGANNEDWDDANEPNQPAQDDDWGDTSGNAQSAQKDDWDLVSRDDFGDDQNTLSKKARNDEKVISKAIAVQPYTILGPARIQQLQKEKLQELSDLFGISMEDAGVLLRAYRWDKTKLEEEWFSDSKKVRDKVGLHAPQLSNNPPVQFMCTLCAETVSWANTCALGCGHRFCEDCWKGWLNAEFEKGVAALFTYCPQHKCKEIVPPSVQARFLTEERCLKFQEWIIDNFIQSSRGTKWCPNARCGRAAATSQPGMISIACTCGFDWCFACRDEDHRPISCEQLTAWAKLNQSDSENIKWIQAYTKECPKCKVHIEKNQGCNHMTCRSCKHEFCWLCKANWSGHNSCSKFQNPEEKAAQNAKNDLERLMHFFDRFENHRRAIKFAEKTKLEAHARMIQLQELRGSGILEVQYLMDAVAAVIKCHQVLQWTYVYSFYLKPNAREKALFEDQQARLEEFTDKLHELAEKPVEELVDHRMRTDIINYTKLIERFRTNVLDAVDANRAP